MRRLPKPDEIVQYARCRLPFGSPETAPDSTLPFMRRRPTVTPILPVNDMSEACDFYRLLGFDVTAYDDGYAWVRSCGWEILHLRLVDAFEPDANETSAYLHVADVDAWRAAMAGTAGGHAVDAPQDTPWGMREFSFTDPSGNLVRLGQNV